MAFISYCPKCRCNQPVYVGKPCPVCSQVTISEQTIACARENVDRFRKDIIILDGKLAQLEYEMSETRALRLQAISKLMAILKDYPEPQEVTGE